MKDTLMFIVGILIGFIVGIANFDKPDKQSYSTEQVLCLEGTSKMNVSNLKMAGRITIKENAVLEIMDSDFIAIPLEAK